MRTFVTRVSFLLSEIHMSIFLNDFREHSNLVNTVQLILLACCYFIGMAHQPRNDQLYHKETHTEINTRWGKSRFTVVSMQKSSFLCYYLLIIILLFIHTTNLLLPHPSLAIVVCSRVADYKRMESTLFQLDRHTLDRRQTFSINCMLSSFPLSPL